MFILRNSVSLAACLFGYFIGKQNGGWGGGVICAFVFLCIATAVIEMISGKKDYVIAAFKGSKAEVPYTVVGIAFVLGASLALWGK